MPTGMNKSSFFKKRVTENDVLHSQQTDTRTENEILHILTHRWVLNNENTWTQGGEHHTQGYVGGGWPEEGSQRRDSRRWGSWGGITLGEMADVGDSGDGDSKQPWHVYTYAIILQDLHMYPRT